MNETNELSKEQQEMKFRQDEFIKMVSPLLEAKGYQPYMRQVLLDTVCKLDFELARWSFMTGIKTMINFK